MLINRPMALAALELPGSFADLVEGDVWRRDSYPEASNRGKQVFLIDQCKAYRLSKPQVTQGTGSRSAHNAPTPAGCIDKGVSMATTTQAAATGNTDATTFPPPQLPSAHLEHPRAEVLTHTPWAGWYYETDAD
jgi:hypothetical protein